jgi:hypothetical protein
MNDRGRAQGPAPDTTPTTGSSQSLPLGANNWPDDHLLHAALDLAGKGWAVLPCNERSGINAKAPYLAHGFHDASTDPEAIAAWWRHWPPALIGCPIPDTLLVLDIDPRNGGSYEAVTEALGPLPPTLTCWSGRADNGRHLYFRRPACKVSSAALPVGVDLKTNGYCIVPPSRHPATGFPYYWDPREPAALTARAVTALRPKLRLIASHGRFTAPGGLGGLAGAVANAADGNRNKILYWACRRAVEGGAVRLADLQQLIDAAAATGLSTDEAERTATSALKGAGVMA